MSQQQMHDYINAQLQKGFTPDQIRQTLVANGWPAQEIDSYFLSLSSQTPPTTPSTAPSSRNKYSKFILPVIVILLLITGGMAYVFSRNSSATTQQTETATPSQVASPSTSDTASTVQEATPPSITTFEEHLAACIPYQGTFQHPLTEETMEREITGEIDGKCQYVEQMPNGGKMDCSYTEYERRAVAQYYLDLAAAESVGTSVTSDGIETTAEYTIDGNVVANPLAEAMENGTCVISGY